ncbi:hypothetical protein PMAYCL1PPCAC_02182 [Pristionchus mayeri]|uniref:Uncharacterized protein n=1 Tax=Pristionchus mayeri TaxID=1317129 RepID=A0AAN4YZX1_9BILA|nr:hypothetical protein PMAYCL1PPCAC_02182 [Pristionchus mayeri]
MEGNITDMVKFIYYRDGDEEHGPFDENAVLEKYNGAEFTSDVTFQIRSSETDVSAPFVQLRDLIYKNGPHNPFRDDYDDLDKRIEEAEKELEELRKIANKKSELERKVSEIQQKQHELKKKHQKDVGFDESVPSTSGEYIEEDKNKELVDTDVIALCKSCNIVYANSKQYLLHINEPCRGDTSNESKALKRQFEGDLVRWKEEDAVRLSMGRSLFSKMSANDKGCARPHTDFIEDIGTKLKKNMSIGTEAGRAKSMEFLKSEPGEKIKERLEKHLREAKGNLVCNKCKVACKTHVHFLNHLTTFDHRYKVKETPAELVCLLLGWFNREHYLMKADPSELDEKIEPDPTSNLDMKSLRISGNKV